MGHASEQVGDNVAASGRRVQDAVGRLQAAVGHAGVAAEVQELMSASRSVDAQVVTALRNLGEGLRQAASDYRAADVKLAANIPGSV